ncbi:MAG TPA: carboxypeptidase-like regulatory domain-containing protein, partial [Puia sp.]|nr:carboxypeptidase-like regulatory domain-containing protein [Puia sp.]
NFLEFVSDHYGLVNFDYHFNGFLFNRIPLVKKLKWREVASIKLLYGGIRPENDPTQNSSLYKFPVDKNGQQATFSLDSGPYIEGSVGISNIFKLFRIDYVQRFTYLNHPGIASWGIRGRFKFDF